MFYMDNAKMLFGDAKASCDGKVPQPPYLDSTSVLTSLAAIKTSVESKL